MTELTENEETKKSAHPAGRLDEIVIRPFLPGQTIEYYVLFCLQSGKHQAYAMTQFIIKTAIEKNFTLNINQNQVSGALQRLKKDSLVTYDSKWDLVL